MPIEFRFQTHKTLAEWEAAHGHRLPAESVAYWRMRPEYSQLPKEALGEWDARETREQEERRKQFEVQNAEAEALLTNIGRKIVDALDGKMHFALLLFEKDSDGLFYTSNCQRADIVKAMQEFIKKVS